VSDPLMLDYPFTGRWMARNSPASRVPSHGTTLFGSAYAIDLIGVDDTGRSAPWGLRAALATEPPERFVGFGRTLLAPVAGRVVAVHDDEVDHAAHRSVPAGVLFLLGQGRRVRAGQTAVAGNHVVIAASERGPFVLLAHLRRGSARVRVGDRLVAGDPVGECGNSGNSIQPHVHLQATDSVEWSEAGGVPIRFRGADGQPVLPRNSEIVDVRVP
jgi:hypothetical protein